MCQSIINAMLKVEGSNPGVSVNVYKRLLSFAYAVGQERYLVLSVVLLVLND